MRSWKWSIPICLLSRWLPLIFFFLSLFLTLISFPSSDSVNHSPLRFFLLSSFHSWSYLLHNPTTTPCYKSGTNSFSFSSHPNNPLFFSFFFFFIKKKKKETYSCNFVVQTKFPYFRHAFVEFPISIFLSFYLYVIIPKSLTREIHQFFNYSSNFEGIIQTLEIFVINNNLTLL